MNNIFLPLAAYHYNEYGVKLKFDVKNEVWTYFLRSAGCETEKSKAMFMTFTNSCKITAGTDINNFYNNSILIKI